MKMTNQNEIIIDGVDVSGCFYCDSEDTITPLCDNKTMATCHCKDNKDCNYKQLLRAEQQIAEDENLQCDMRGEIERLQAENEALTQKCEELKKDNSEWAQNDYYLRKEISELKIRANKAADIAKQNLELFYKVDELETKNKSIHEIASDLQERNHNLVLKCEELEKEIQTMNESIKAGPLCYKCGEEDCIKKDNDVLKQALAEIAEIAEKASDNMTKALDPEETTAEESFEMFYEVDEQIEKILQKVKEVLR